MSKYQAGNGYRVTLKEGFVNPTEQNYLKIFGANIKARRLNKGMRQKDVSSKAGIAQSAYSNYEDGRVEIPLTTALKIVAVLGAPLEETCGFLNSENFKSRHGLLLRRDEDMLIFNFSDSVVAIPFAKIEDGTAVVEPL